MVMRNLKHSLFSPLLKTHVRFVRVLQNSDSRNVIKEKERIITYFYFFSSTLYVPILSRAVQR